VADSPAGSVNDVLPGALSRGTIRTSAVWIGVGFGYSQVLRLVANVVLAYLLYPEAFGLLAMAYTVMIGLLLFSDLGIRTSVVQNSRGDEPAFLNTAWTLQVIRGFLLGAAACALAWPIAFLRQDPEPTLLWILPLLGVSAVIDGFASTKLLSLQRHLQQRKIVLIEVVTQTTGNGVTVIWAAIDGNVLALAMGPICGSAAKAIISHLLPGVPNRFQWDRRAAHELFHFAKWVYLSTVLFYFAGNADKLVVGYRSLELLGVYHIAAQLAAVAVLLMGSVAGQLLFPLYSRSDPGGTDYPSRVHRTHLIAGTIAALMVAGTIAAGPTLIACLYDHRYQAAAWMLPLLAIGAWFQIIETNAGQALLAKGKPHYGAYGNGIKVVCLAIFVPTGAWIDGLRGMIIGFVLGDLARYLFTAIVLERQHIKVLASDLALTLFVAAVGIGTRVLSESIHSIDPQSPKNWGRLLFKMAGEGAAVVFVWSVVAMWMRKRRSFRVVDDGQSV
jgi:O-antigen/teichoic acid export membrane protein